MSQETYKEDYYKEMDIKIKKVGQEQLKKFMESFKDCNRVNVEDDTDGDPEYISLILLNVHGDEFIRYKFYKAFYKRFLKPQLINIFVRERLSGNKQIDKTLLT